MATSSLLSSLYRSLPFFDDSQRSTKQSDDIPMSLRAEDDQSEAANLLEKGSQLESDLSLHHTAVTSESERRLVRKLDKRIMPLAMLLYLSAYLDRGNLGNARLQGLQEQVLDGSDRNYSFAVSCFFITYITLSLPGTLLAKAIMPSLAVSIGALIWSLAATGQAFTTTATSLYVCRLFVGVGESMYGQTMALYFSIWYKKDEIAKRVGLFIACGALAGAGGGLIAFGVSSISKTSVDRWRILFLVEGLPSLVLAIACFRYLPTRPECSTYLSDAERMLACRRLRHANPGTEIAIDWTAVEHALKTPRTYIVAIMYSCVNFCLTSVSSFLPGIIKGLGYQSAQAQLMTAPAYLVTVIVMYALTSYSDKRQTRGLPTASVFLIGTLGWTILASIDAVTGSLRLRYFGCICVVAASYSAIPLIVGWQSNNCPSESQRAVSLGMLNTVGQCLSVAAAYAFPSHQAPQFVAGTSLNIVFQLLGCTIAVGLSLYYRLENKKRDEGTAKAGKHFSYDQSREFRYVC